MSRKKIRVCNIDDLTVCKIDDLTVCKNDDLMTSKSNDFTKSKMDDMSNCKSGSLNKGKKNDLTKNEIDDFIKRKSVLSTKCNSSGLTNCKKFPVKLSSPSLDSNPAVNQSNFDSDEIDNISDVELLEQLSILNSLEKRERELKTSILYERLWKEEPKLSDDTLLSEIIAENQKHIQEIATDLQLKEIMCSRMQLAEILQEVVFPHSKRSKTKDVLSKSDETQALILGLVLRKKQINKEISLQQQEIAKMEEKCLKLNSIINRCTSETEVVVPNSKDNEELRRLKEGNQKRSSRVQLLSKILHSLISNIGTDCIMKDDLKGLAIYCKDILNWNYNDLDEMEELCKKVNAVEI